MFEDKSSEDEVMAVSTPFNLLDGFGTIAKFSGDDRTYSASKWAQDIEDNAEIFGWSPQQKLIIARRTLTGTTELWLRSKKVFRSYSELKGAVLKEFPESVNCKEMHEYMAARRKNKDESYYQYMLVMKELGKRAKFPDYVAIQYIIDGIDDVQQNKVILYGVTTYPILKEKLAVYEKMKNSEGRGANETKPKKSNTVNCFKCGQRDHTSKICPNGLKCFRCNGYGHIAGQCKSVGKPVMGQRPAYHSAPAAARTMEATSSRMTSQQVASPGSSRQAFLTDATAEYETGIGLNLVKDEVAVDSTTAIGHCGKMADQEQYGVYDVTADVNKSLKKPIKVLNINENMVNALIDSGSDVNLITKECCERIGTSKYMESDIVLTGLGSSKVSSLGVWTCESLNVDGHCYDNVAFYVVPTHCMPFEFVIGNDFLKNVFVIFTKGGVWMRPAEERWLSKLDCFQCDVDAPNIGRSEVEDEVGRCVKDYRPRQIMEVPLQLKIVLKDDIPVAQRPRRISFMEQQVVERQVAEWLEQGIIRVSYSEYASPLVLVRKKDGGTRVCVDYRLINKKIVKDEYPLPRFWVLTEW